MKSSSPEFTRQVPHTEGTFSSFIYIPIEEEETQELLLEL